MPSSRSSNVFAPVILAACLQVFFLRLGLTGRPGGVFLGQLLIAYPFAVILFSSFWNERMRLSLARLTITSSPRTGTCAPTSPVLPPCGMRAAPRSLAQRANNCTCATSAGTATEP